MGINVHVMHTGRVRVSPQLPFGGDDCGIVKASGLFVPEDERLWLPVSAYLIEHPRGLVLLDCGWSRQMSPVGIYDAAAQKRHLSPLLYRVNQGVVESGATAREQLERRGIRPADIDIVLMSHLGCDHASGLVDLVGARRVLVAADELRMVARMSPLIRTRFRSSWWRDANVEPFEFKDTGSGPVGRSFDVFGDGSVELVSIPGHTDGLIATVVRGSDGRFVNLVSDGAYGARSWRDMVLPGIALDKDAQRASLAWIRRMDEDPLCIETVANHDAELEPHVIELS